MSRLQPSGGGEKKKKKKKKKKRGRTVVKFTIMKMLRFAKKPFLT